MEEFRITVMHNSRVLEFPVKLQLRDLFEIYTIKGRNTLVLQSNLPLLLSKGLKHRRPNWKVLEGKVTNASTLEKLQEALEARSRAAYK